MKKTPSPKSTVPTARCLTCSSPHGCGFVGAACDMPVTHRGSDVVAGQHAESLILNRLAAGYYHVTSKASPCKDLVNAPVSQAGHTAWAESGGHARGHCHLSCRPIGWRDCT